VLVFGLYDYNNMAHVAGQLIPPDGFVFGVGVDTAFTDPAVGFPLLFKRIYFSDIVDQGDGSSSSLMAEEDLVTAMFVDGKFHSCFSEDQYFLIPFPSFGGLDVSFMSMANYGAPLNALIERENTYFLDIDGDGVSDHQRTTSDYFYEIAVGNRIILRWQPIPDSEPDFGKYVIFWDGGSGGAVDQFFAEVEQRDITTYVTSAQPTGIYKFKILYEDRLGNRGRKGGDQNLVYLAKTLTPPDKPSAQIVYTSSTRQATITVSGVESPNDFVVYWNIVESEGLHLDFAHQQGFAQGTKSGLTFVTPELFEGAFVFSVVQVNQLGVPSLPATLTLRLQKVGGELVEFPDVIMPSEVTIESLSRAADTLKARFKVEFELDSETWTYVALLVDGVDVAHISRVAGQTSYSYVYTDVHVDGTDGVTHGFVLKAVYDLGGTLIESSLTESISAVCDASPPLGDQILDISLAR
jgi:hypothetical protein